jgi:low affinity Fe/Cu permease
LANAERTEKPTAKRRDEARKKGQVARSSDLNGSVVLVVVWALTGPIFKFSDTWQLFINTSTTVITFWMVFVIQNSANRQGKATQLKRDEMIRLLLGGLNSAFWTQRD